MSTMTHTYTRTHMVTTPANPYLVCGRCGQRVEGFLGLYDEGPSALYTCEHENKYHSKCPSWGPVDGCECVAHLGYRPHGDPARPLDPDNGQGPV